ncbi:hypothetical protein PFISCL1PPCAC_28374 [Pristionchus fissidentatus]|uniref:Carboxylic ester hydrolase n=2 Tax=Pristionchus fissidentatus TaxID=1538716 RepID=A0AAV5X3T4_9BILA|nr:hypothetical protein PFISCL1PPCAC_28374 [Pristionchus fissidentatus]
MTPSITPFRLFPVMVFIHGGSLSSGSARNLSYEGAIRNFVRHGVVVVTIQYRIGLLGFFNTGTDDFPGNLGMLDQVEALRWAQSEIVHFGGDPNRVTLFGYSAGAASISAHTYSSMSRGLFHSVILQSGSVLTCFDGALGSTDLSPIYAQKLCNFTSVDWKAGNFSRLHTCLDTIDLSIVNQMEKPNFLGWKIIQDPFFFPSTPQKLAPFRSNIPVLIGSMQDEFAYFLFSLKQLYGSQFPSSNRLLPFLAPLLFQNATQVDTLLPLITSKYAPTAISENADTAWLKANSDAITGGAFVAPMQKDIREWMQNGNFHIFIYEMTVSSHLQGFHSLGIWNPAVHTGEMPYVTGDSRVWEESIRDNRSTPFDFALMEWMGQAWTNFAISGIPDAAWSPVSPLSAYLPYLEISSTGLRMRPDYRSDDDWFWNVQIPKVVGDLPAEKMFIFHR